MIVVAAQAPAVAFRTALGLVDILDNTSIDGCLYPAEHQGRVSRLVYALVQPLYGSVQRQIAQVLMMYLMSATPWAAEHWSP